MKNITVLRLNKILRKAALLTAPLCLISMLCGCSAGFFSGDLLTSPRLSDEQTEIYNALTASAGRVDLRYPHTGEYRSAFVIHNIDDEPTDEAIVFYEQSKTDAAKEPATEGTAVGNLRISFLDKDEDGNWKATYELPAAGTEIESVAFSKLGSDKEKLLISYSVLGSSDKIMSVIDYKDGIAKQLGSVGYSSYIFLNGLDDNGSEYLACFNHDGTKKSGNMTVYSCNGNGDFGMAFPVNSFGEGVTEFDKISTAQCLILGKKKPCITIDYLTAENQYNTAVLYYKGNSFATADTIVMNSENINYSRRTNGYTPKVQSQDIDGDGIVDVPATSALPGYENLTFPEQLNAVRWYRQDCSKIELTAYTFVEPGRNYMLIFPGRWVGMVTATLNESENSVTFWKHEGNLKENEYALLTIKTVLKSDTSSQSEPDVLLANRDGFRLFSDDSEKTIYYKSIMYERLSLTDDEIEAALKVRPEGYGNNDVAALSKSN